MDFLCSLLILELFLQITSSVLGNLLDVIEEVRAARVDLQNLPYTSFCSPSGNTSSS